MKPDWKDAPEWAQYLALDGDGWWVWFEEEPEWCDSDKQWLPFEGEKCQVADGGRDCDGVDWDFASSELYARPK